MLRDERGFTLIEMAAAVAILALLTAAGTLWVMGLRPAGLRATLDQYDSTLAATRALAQSGDNGATLVFEPDVDSFRLRAFRGRPNAPGAVSPTSIAAEGDGVTLRERTLGAPPFAIFFGTGGHVSGVARYPETGPDGGPLFSVIGREPMCPRGGFTFTFSTSAGARVSRMLPCAGNSSPAPAPNPTPTPNRPLLSPSHLVFSWPGAPAQRVAATEWGYTHWFASAGGFACAGGAVKFPDVLPAPFTDAWSSSEAAAAPLPPPSTPYSFPNSFGASMNDAPAFFPLLPQAAGLCRVDVVDAFAQHAGALAQVMGAIALQDRSGSPARAVDLLLARRAPVIVYAAKTYDSQPIVPAAGNCAGSLQVTPGIGVAPPVPSMLPARTPMVLRGLRAGSCTLEVRSQYPGEPPALLGVSVRGPLAVDPPAILLAPAGSTLAVPTSTAAIVVADTAAHPAKGDLALKISAGCPNAGNSWTGPLDGRCYDLYDLTVSSESTDTWTTIGIDGFYVPHGTPGAQFLAWQIQDSGGCYVTMTAGTSFAHWFTVLSNGDPQPPPVGAAPVTNGAGFTLEQTAHAIDALTVSPPAPKIGATGPCKVLPGPPPPGEGNPPAS